MTWRDHDDLDGCAVAGEGPYVADDDLDGIVLFADVADPDDDNAVERRRAEWLELFA